MRKGIKEEFVDQIHLFLCGYLLCKIVWNCTEIIRKIVFERLLNKEKDRKPSILCLIL